MEREPIRLDNQHVVDYYWILHDYYTLRHAIGGQWYYYTQAMKEQYGQDWSPYKPIK